MKNKNSLIRLLFLFVFLLVVLLIVLIFMLLKIFIFKDTNKKVKDIITNNYDISDISNLSFDFKKATVVIKGTNEDNLSITQNTKEEKFYLNNQKYDHKLMYVEDSYMFDNKELKYTIRVPVNYKGNLVINNNYGTLKIYNIKNNLIIDNNSADVNIYRSGDMTIKDVSGKINLNDVTGNITITSSTGNINISNFTGEASIDTLTGDVNIDNFKIEGNSSIENISGNINISIDKNSECKIKYSNDRGNNNITKDKCKNKNNILDVKNVTGNINIK